MNIQEQLKSRLFIILLLTLFYITSLSITRPILSLYAKELGLSPVMLGLLISTFAVFPIILSVQAGKWSDRFGSKRMMMIGTTSFFTALLIPSLYPSVTTLFLSQALVGLGHNLMMISMQKVAGNSGNNRDQSIASLSLVTSVGEFFGPLIGGFSYEMIGFQGTFLLAAFLIVVSFGCNLLLKSKPIASNEGSMAHTKSASSFQMLRNANIRKALVVSGLTIASKDLFVSYFPLYGTQIGLTPSQIGIVLSMTAAAFIFVRAIQYPLVAKFTRGGVLLSSLALGGGMFIAIPFMGEYVLLCVLSFMLGLGLGLGQPLSLVYIFNASPAGRVGEALGLRIMCNRTFQLSAPTLFGLLGGALGVSPIFWTCGAFLLFGSWYSREDKAAAAHPETGVNG